MSSVEALGGAGARSESVSSRIVLSCGQSGSWKLTAAHLSREFPDFAAALSCARQLPAAKSATIEVWQEGEYICCLPPHPVADGEAFQSRQVRAPSRLAAAAEHYASRAGGMLYVTAGPVFWLALAAAVVAASLGWRLTLH